MIRVLFFARIRDQLGVPEVAMALEEGVATVAGLTEQLINAHPDFAEVLARPNVLIAVNQEFAGPDSPVGDGDEIAYFPPVTGG